MLEITLRNKALYVMFFCLLLLTWNAQGKTALPSIVHALRYFTPDLFFPKRRNVLSSCPSENGSARPVVFACGARRDVFFFNHGKS
jgi:hypothetical protein